MERRSLAGIERDVTIGTESTVTKSVPPMYSQQVFQPKLSVKKIYLCFSKRIKIR
jgi:hypothetical protein